MGITASTETRRNRLSVRLAGSEGIDPAIMRNLLQHDDRAMRSHVDIEIHNDVDHEMQVLRDVTELAATLALRRPNSQSRVSSS
jgi:hypothetical protein